MGIDPRSLPESFQKLCFDVALDQSGSARRAPAQNEEREQIDLFRWRDANLRAHPELRWLIHVPNGGYRSPAVAGRLKAAGVARGVPDCFLFFPRKHHCGLVFEMKRRGGGSLSKEQEEWLIHFHEAGWRTGVCHGWEEAVELILDYIGAR